MKRYKEKLEMSIDKYNEEMDDETYWQFIKERVMTRYDFEELLVELDVDMDEFVERFSDRILMSMHELDVM
jgi:hypothetical protein